MTPSTWSVAIFSSREDAATLRRTLQAVLVASASHATTIDLFVDSNATTAEAMSHWTPPFSPNSTVRLWSVPWKDKACTWNRYIHDVATHADVAYFVDGYVRPNPDSFSLLDDALANKKDAWAATAVPTIGPSARALRASLLREGGLHGSLYALPRWVVDRFRSRNFRLPLGLYRNDSLIGAVAAFGGDPAATDWDPLGRIAVAENATWDNDLPGFGVERIRSYFKRRLRQAQGDLENAAIHRHLAVERRTPESLARSVDGLIADKSNPVLAHRGPVGRFLMRRAARTVGLNDWSRCDAPAKLMKTWSAS